MPSEYEITYLSDPNLSDDTRGEVDSSIDSQITQLGGAIAQSSPSIRRRLNFPIKDQTVGFLRALNIQIEPDQINAVKTFLNKKKEILRATVLATSPQAEVTPDMLFKTAAPKTKTSDEPTTKKPTKAVTEEEVDKGIAEALQEEVK